MAKCLSLSGNVKKVDLPGFEWLSSAIIVAPAGRHLTHENAQNYENTTKIHLAIIKIQCKEGLTM